MQSTPESNVYHEKCKGQHCYDCSDSGYSGVFYSPHSKSGVNPCRALLSSVDFDETPKENLRLSVSPQERTKESIRCMGIDSNRVQRQSPISWCETPKVHKRDGSLRHRLLSKLTTDSRGENTKSPNNGVRSDHWLSVSFDSIDSVPPALTRNALKPGPDLLSGRKRRHLFSQIRTSTLEDGNLNCGQHFSLDKHVLLRDAEFNTSNNGSDQFSAVTPLLSKSFPASSRENSQSPVSSLTNDLYDGSSVLVTPSSTHTPRYNRSQYEDSGFSSLTLDKSADSLVDHDGSFQELLLSAPKGRCETPNLAETNRRARLQRQHRLSTLKEGGSQSEEDVTDRRHQHRLCNSHSKGDQVFHDCDTPSKVVSGEGGNSMPFGIASDELSCTPSLRQTSLKPEATPPCSTIPIHSAVTPLKKIAADLALTPALQLVHAMCQERAQIFTDQSPTLKEQLKSAAALGETPRMFRTTMPLVGLIGRKMGLGKVDILTELRKRNLLHILAIILNYLSSDCIYRCCHVCKSWNGIIQQDQQASTRREIYLGEVEAVLEIRGAVHVADADTRLTLQMRSALKTVQPQSRTSNYCTPKSGNSTLKLSHNSTSCLSSGSKRDKFLEVAKTLFNDECLKPCPHCQHPARCHSVKREGVCSRVDCGFQFCTACLCAFHGSRECGSQSAGRRKKDILPGSAQSKRNIRRL